MEVPAVGFQLALWQLILVLADFSTRTSTRRVF
jgi:hypothetical protein